MVDVSRHGRFRVEVVSPNISASHGSGSPEKRMANRFNGPCHGMPNLRLLRQKAVSNLFDIDPLTPGWLD